MIEYLVARNPQKNYGRIEFGEIAGTLLATDYKSPHIIMEIDYDRISSTQTQKN